MSVFSDNLGFLTKKYGLSLREVARRAQIPNAILSNAMRGVSNPRQATVEKVAAVFDMDAKSFQMVPLTASAEAPKTQEATPRPLKDTFCALGEPLVFKSPFPNTVGADTLLDDEKRVTAWRNALRAASDGEGEALLTMTMPTDDLAPVIPRGAILYLAVETDPSHPTLPEDTPVVGVLPLENGEQTLVFGYPSVSLGRVSLKTANGNSVAVDKVIAYIKGWTVFKFLSRVSYRTAS